jgi:hypothetical protein
MVSLAKFHSTSHALIMENGGNKDIFLEKHPLLRDILIQPFMSSMMNPTLEALVEMLKVFMYQRFC